MPSYIMDLRKLVGHRTLMQCAASIIIVNEKNQILLGQIITNGDMPGVLLNLTRKWRIVQEENCLRRQVLLQMR